MAVTSTKNPREIIYGADIGTAANTNGTAQQPQQQASTYKPSAQVQQAQQQMQQIQAAKPQGYSSKYDAQLQSILQQIQNPEKFQHNFNDDELFKYYADLYSQKGKQASMDAMGQATALTGGYGNSYAQQVGNQAYDQYMLSLYDKGMELRDRAYQQYQDMLANRYNQYNVLSQQDQVDYGRYRDSYGDWQNELNYYTDMYNNEYNRDYTNFADQRAFDENVRQFNESLNWDMMSTEQKYAADYAMQLIAMGQMPSDELLAAAGLSAEDAQKILTPMMTVVGGGGTTPKKTGQTETLDPMSFYDASVYVLQNSPLSTPLSSLSINKNATGTLGDLAAKAAAKTANQNASKPITINSASTLRDYLGKTNDITEAVKKKKDGN